MAHIAWHPNDWDIEKVMIRAAWAFALLAVLISAYMIWQLFKNEPMSSRPVISESNDVTYANEVNVNLLNNADLFGFKQSAVVASSDDAPKTKLALSLKGVIASSDQEKARAWISEKGKTEEVYRIGDELPGQAILHEVFPDKIILKVRGRLETLWLFDPDAKIQWMKPAGLLSDKGHSFNTPKVRKMLSHFKRTILSRSPMAMARMIRINPEFKQGKMDGVRVFPGPQPEPFELMGLKPNDLVRSINGIELDSLAKASMLLGGLKEAKDLNVVLERSGQKLSLYYQFAED